jgi:eukaryotic-like serine/threonine-protein kinase
VTLSAGTLLGPYQVVAPLGAGGMGEVWKAKDTRLDRLVAVKVLPGHLAQSPEALARFEREAKAVAALNHPNILGLFDVGREDDTVYAVMELLEGKTLRAYLADGPLAPRKVTELAMQMAQGLAAAHEKGIIHRDLKPENLWITRDGRLKILDFGLAKQMSGKSDGAGQSIETASLDHQTGKGTIIGTMGYMSPEQVRGEPLDGRSDLFSFGVVLFEMLTGKAAFARGTASDTLAAILRDDPAELEATDRPIPPGLQRVIGHCLEKEPQRRFQGAADLSFALESALGDSGTREVQADPPSPRRAFPFLRVAALGLFCLFLGAGLDWVFRMGAEPSSIVSLRLLTHGGQDTSPAASPDGKTIAFTSDRDGQPRIWLKQIRGGGEMAITTGPDDDPRFSPDGSAILFTRTDGERTSLYRTALMGSDPRKVVEDAMQGDWSPDGKRIAFLRIHKEKSDQHVDLCLVDSGGSSERELARFPGQFVAFPRWGPDSRRILLTSSRYRTPGGIRKFLSVDAMDGSSSEIKPPDSFGILSSAAWISAEEIAYLQAELPTATGTAVSPARAYRQNLRTGACQALFWTANFGGVIDLLPNGRLIFDAMSGRQNLREYSLDERTPPRWLTRGHTNDRQPVFAPGGEWVVFSSDRSGNLDLWGVSTRTGALRSMTDDPADDWDPGFSPDGQSLLWSSNRGGHLEVWASNPDGTEARQITHDGEDAENPTQTRDGKWIVYCSSSKQHYGLWKIHPDGTGVRQLSQDSAIALPEVSPDGAHVLFQTRNETKVLIRVIRVEDGKEAPFVITLDPQRSSVTYSGRARWTPDGKHIIFTGQSEKGLMGIFIQDFVPGSDTTATRRPLAGFDPDWITESLGLSPDGKRLVLSESERAYNLMIADGSPGLDRRGKIR